MLSKIELDPAVCFNTFGCFPGDEIEHVTNGKKGVICRAEIGMKKNGDPICRLKYKLEQEKMAQITLNGEDTVRDNILKNKNLRIVSKTGVSELRSSLQARIERIRRLAATEENADVDFLLEGKVIKAHSAWLMVSSTGFKELLSGSTRSFDLKEYTFEHFKMIRDYIYGLDIEMTSKNVDMIFELANRYQLDDLIKTCNDFKANKICPKSILENHGIAPRPIPNTVPRGSYWITDNEGTSYIAEPSEACFLRCGGVFPESRFSRSEDVPVTVLGSVQLYVKMKGIVAHLFFQSDNEKEGVFSSLYTPAKIKFTLIQPQFSNPAKMEKFVVSSSTASIADRIQKMAETRLGSDVNFLIREELKAHSWWLSQSSDYFKALLGTNFKEGQDKTIKMAVDDYSSEDFKIILSYLYTGKLDLTEENVQNVYMLADEFLLPDLKEECRIFLGAHLTYANVWQYFKNLLDANLEETSFFLEVREFLYNYLYKMFDSDDPFSELSTTGHMKSLLKQQFYKVPEDLLLPNVVEWIQFQKLTSEEANALLCGIRFEHIDLSQFWRAFGGQNILDDRLMIDWSIIRAKDFPILCLDRRIERHIEIKSKEELISAPEEFLFTPFSKLVEQGNQILQRAAAAKLSTNQDLQVQENDEEELRQMRKKAKINEETKTITNS